MSSFLLGAFSGLTASGGLGVVSKAGLLDLFARKFRLRFRARGAPYERETASEMQGFHVPFSMTHCTASRLNSAALTMWSLLLMFSRWVSTVLMLRCRSPA